MVLQNINLVKILGSKIDVVCARVGGANTTPYLSSAAHFAKQKLIISFLLLQNMKSVGEKIWAIPNPARIHSPDPFLRAVQEPRQSEKTFFPRKIDFRFAESVLKPHALPRNFLGRTPKEKHPFLFQEKFHPRQIRNARSVFSFGVAGVLASAWGFLRAYDLVSSHHALRACDIICFENRFELGTIETPKQNLTAFSKPEGGTREARPTDFPPFFQTNSDSRLRRDGLFFRQEAGAKSEAILTNSICFGYKNNFLSL